MPNCIRLLVTVFIVKLI